MIRAAGAVYIVGGDGGSIKIGVSSSPTSRAKALASQTKRQLRVMHVFVRPDADAEVVERAAHALLKASRLDGEWFDVSEIEALEAVEAAIIQAQGQPAPINRTIIKAKDDFLSIRLPPDTADRLATLADADKRSVSSLARLVLEAWMDGEPLPERRRPAPPARRETE